MSFCFSLQADFQIAITYLLLATKLSNVLRMSMSVMAGFIVRSMNPMLKMRISTFANPEELSLKEQTLNVLKHIVLKTHQSKYLPPPMIYI
jgi:uncharacterized membrane protein YagU involved in acid resistance